MAFADRKARKAGKRTSKKSSGFAGKTRKLAGRPKIPNEDGCTVEDGWSGDKHCYKMFGKPQETCVKCGKEHELITRWRKNIAEGNSDSWMHPFVEKGYWSFAEYKKAMKR
jgi:hypothetical protein